MKNINELVAEDFTPLGDNIFVKPEKIEQKDKFFRPQQEEDKSEIGRVLSIGTRVAEIKVGDVIIFNKYSSTQLDFGDVLVLREVDVIAKTL